MKAYIVNVSGRHIAQNVDIAFKLFVVTDKLPCDYVVATYDFSGLKDITCGATPVDTTNQFSTCISSSHGILPIRKD